MRPLIVAAGLIGALFVGSSVQADPLHIFTPGETVFLRQTDNLGNVILNDPNGGPFRLDVAPFDGLFPPFGAGGDIITFCLELNEPRLYDTALRINQITGSAFLGGRGGPSPDPISAQTDFLFVMSYLGTPGYTNGPVVQRVIWFFEDEGVVITPSSAEDLLVQRVLADMAAGVPKPFSTHVLDLFIGTTDERHQDVLVPGDPVPEPASLVLVGSGLLAVGVRLRKRLSGR